MPTETISFYSYKGGSGRSLLLTNAARYLAAIGKKVVAIDFDLEAPGLHYKMQIGGRSSSGGRAKLPEFGVVDYLLQATEGKPPKSIKRFLRPVALPNDSKGSLHLMAAGSAPSGTYWRTLTTLMRADPFSDMEGSGLAACLEMKAAIERETGADFILIDSRTGITELAGLATTLLADKVVCLVINNPESLAGARAVLSSLGKAPRLKNQKPIEIIPVMSRVPDRSETTRKSVLSFLQAQEPDKTSMPALQKLFVLRSEPELASEEKVFFGTEEQSGKSLLQQDYLEFFGALTEAEPTEAKQAVERFEATQALKRWLTEENDSRFHPEPFSEDQIVEGVLFGSNFADLVAYADASRKEPWIIAVYASNPDTFKHIWNDIALRCLIVYGSKKRRIFTRRKRHEPFQERDQEQAWFVKWKASFTALEDPADRSVDSMITAVQRGEISFLGLLQTEWEHCMWATLHGGYPYRPHVAKRIVDGLAEIHKPQLEREVLWGMDPGRYGRRRMSDFGADFMQDLLINRVYRPLWWRFSLETKMAFLREHGPKVETSHADELDFLARDLLGLRFDQDEDFRKAVELLASDDRSDDDSLPFHNFAGYFEAREIKYILSEEAPPEIVRRLILEKVSSGDESSWKYWDREERHRLDREPFERAKHDARDQLTKDPFIRRLLKGNQAQVGFGVINLLASYDHENATVLLYPRLIDWVARNIQADARALGNVAFAHISVYALAHLARDLDGRHWEFFGQPFPYDLTFRPSLTLESFAQYFTHRLILQLDDPVMLSALQRLKDHTPTVYQLWPRLADVSIEEMRSQLIRARTGVEPTFLQRLNPHS